jgi:hypothetical protein
MCHMGEFNCSQESMTSAGALAALQELPHTNPTLHSALEQVRSEPVSSEPDFEEDPAFQEGEGDDVEVPVTVVVSHVVSEATMIAEGYGVDDNGRLAWMGETDEIEKEADKTGSGVEVALPLGHGHQVKTELR